MSSQLATHPCLHVLAAHGLYVHSMPGRLRVEVPALLENRPLAAHVEGALRTTPGVQAATASSVTGRVLVKYDRKPGTLSQVMQQMLESRVLPACLHGGPCSFGHKAANGVMEVAAEVLKMGVELALSL